MMARRDPRDRIPGLALSLIAERAEKEGFEGQPFSPPPRFAGMAAQNQYRLSYHAGMNQRKG